MFYKHFLLLENAQQVSKNPKKRETKKGLKYKFLKKTIYHRQAVFITDDCSNFFPGGL